MITRRRLFKGLVGGLLSLLVCKATKGESDFITNKGQDFPKSEGSYGWVQIYGEPNRYCYLYLSSDKGVIKEGRVFCYDEHGNLELYTGEQL